MESKKKTEEKKGKKQQEASFSWKKVLINVGIMLVSFIVIIFIINIILKSYTHHGESLTVPDFKGKTVAEVEQLCADKNVRYFIKDSSYSQGAAPNTVIEQDPKPGQHVKENRRIYLTINSKAAPMIRLTFVPERSVRQTRSELENSGFTVSDEIEYQPCADLNLVQDVKHNGVSVRSGTMLRKGTTLTLVACDGGATGKVEVPDLIGKTFDEAAILINANDLVLGNITTDSGKVVSRTSGKSIIYKQEPEAEAKKIPRGEAVNIWVSRKKR